MLELTPRNEESLRHAFYGLWGPQWWSSLIFIFPGVGFGLLLLLVLHGPGASSILHICYSTFGGVIGFACALMMKRRPIRPAYSRHYVRANDDGFRIRGISGSATLEAQFWWRDIAAISLGRKIFSTVPITRAIASAALVIEEKSGQKTAFELFAVVYEPTAVQSFIDFAVDKLETLPSKLKNA